MDPSSQVQEPIRYPSISHQQDMGAYANFGDRNVLATFGLGFNTNPTRTHLLLRHPDSRYSFVGLTDRAKWEQTFAEMDNFVDTFYGCFCKEAEFM